MQQYDLILKNIEKHIKLDSDGVDFFLGFLKHRLIKKKELLLSAGNACNYINYVNSGLLRAYYLDTNCTEHTIMLAVDDWWVTDLFSYTSQNPAIFYIDALKECDIFQLHKNDLENLYTRVPKFERFFRIIFQNAYIREQLRVTQNISLTAEERYLIFIGKYPKVVERVSQKQIASYLGITQEFLSVMRKKLDKKDHLNLH